MSRKADLTRRMKPFKRSGFNSTKTVSFLPNSLGNILIYYQNYAIFNTLLLGRLVIDNVSAVSYLLHAVSRISQVRQR